MKETKETIWMSGERMEVLLDAGGVQRFDTAVAARLPYIMRKLCKTLHRREVARHFIQSIRIGDTVALVDRKAGLVYRMQMQAHSVRVLGVYEHQSYPREAAQQAVYLLNGRLIWAMSGRLAVA